MKTSIALLSLSLLIPFPLFAQDSSLPVCGPRADLTKVLTDTYKEAPTGTGLEQGGAILELLVSNAKGTWTLMAHSPNGFSCIVTTGVAWRDLRGEPL